MQKITLALEAMATRFEFVLPGSDAIRLRAAGEEASDEIKRLEGQLSLYRSGSEIAQINARAAVEPVRVTPTTFALLQKARALWEETSGAFDVTIGPLVRCWGFMKGSGARPTDEEIARARELVSMDQVELDSATCSVRFQRDGMMIDLGSIGKGYALDVAADILRDAGVQNALLHGGTSTIYGLGRDESGPWKIALDKPQLPFSPAVLVDPAENTLAIVELENSAMSMSAVWGKYFVLDGKTYGHVIDPRTGWPAENALLGCVIAKSAADTDALSTGVLLAGRAELDAFAAATPGIDYLQARLDGDNVQYFCRGINLLDKAVAAVAQPSRPPGQAVPKF